MRNAINQFLKGEDGAVTVDWVVLTAGIVLLGAVVVGGIEGVLLHNSNEIGAFLSNVEPE